MISIAKLCRLLQLIPSDCQIDVSTGSFNKGPVILAYDSNGHYVGYIDLKLESFIPNG